VQIVRKFIWAIILAAFAAALGLWNFLLLLALFVLVIVVFFVFIEISERRRIKALASRPAYCEFASFIPVGQILTVTSQGVIERYAIEHWTRLDHIDCLPVDASLHALSADGCWLAWAIEGNDGESSVSLAEIKTGNRVCTIEHDGLLSSVLISPSGALFGLRNHLNGVHLWDGKTGEPVPLFSNAGSQAADYTFAEFIVFSPDGRFLAGGEEDTVYIWDLEGKDLAQVLGGHSHISALSYNLGGTLLAVADDGSIHIWDANSGEKLRVIDGLHGVQHLIFSPDGRFLVGDGDEGILWIVDIGSGIRLADSSISHARFGCLSFSPDSQQILALSMEARLYRWLLDGDGRFRSTEILTENAWASVG